MITKIGFKNIRVFEDLTEFELKPLTVLTGPNNSGKSTVQKMLILLSSGLKINANIVDLEKLYFKKEFIDKTGDFNSNVNFNSDKNELTFSFNFNDDLFGALKAVLTYKKIKNDVSLFKIAFYDTNEALYALEKVKDEKDNLIWKWDIDLIQTYLPKLHTQLQALREEGVNQIVLGKISKKIEKDSNAVDGFSHNERKIYNNYKNSGIIAGDKRAKDSGDYRNSSWGMSPPHIYNENTKDVFEKNTFAETVLDKFPSKIEYSDFLIYTDLLEIIGHDYDAFINDKNNKENNDLRKQLIEDGLFDYEKFKFEYKQFEINFFVNLFIDYDGFNTTVVDDDEYYGLRVLTIDEVLNKNNQSSWKNFESLYKSDLFKENSIAKILVKNKLIDKQPALFSADIIFGKDTTVKNKKKDTEQQTDFTLQCSNSISFYFNHISKSLKKELFNFLGKNSTALQNHTFKSQYMYGEFDIIDSPFLEYGERYLNNGKGDEFVNYWLKKLGVAEELIVDSIELKSTNKRLGLYYSLVQNKNIIPLKDNGLGINQLILLLLKIVLQKENTFLLEDVYELIAHHKFDKDFKKLSSKDKEWVENDAAERGFNESLLESDMINMYYSLIDELYEAKPGPDAYMTGLSDEEKEEKEAKMKKQAEMDDDDPDSYEELPGDEEARESGKVKKSKHTTAYNKKFKSESMKNLKSFDNFVTEKRSDLWSPFQKADILAGDMFGAMGLYRLEDDELDQIIDLKKADKLAKKMFGEFGFKTLAAKEMEDLLDNNPKLLRESQVTEAKGLPSHARNLSIKLKTHWLPDTDNKDIYFLADTNKGQTITIDLSVRTGEYKVIDKKDNVIYQGGDPYAAAKLIESVVNEFYFENDEEERLQKFVDQLSFGDELEYRDGFSTGRGSFPNTRELKKELDSNFQLLLTQKQGRNWDLYVGSDDLVFIIQPDLGAKNYMQISISSTKEQWNDESFVFARQNGYSVYEAFIGPFVFNDKMSDDELLGMYNGALDGYANYSKGFQHSKSDYKRAYQEIEKILKKIISLNLLSKFGVIAIERDGKVKAFTWPPSLTELKVRSYGAGSIHYGVHTERDA